MLRMLAAIALAVHLTSAALLYADDPPKGDKDLDGTWEQTAVVHEGEDQPAAGGDKLVVTIMGDSITFTVGKDVETGKLKIDAGKKPKVADLVPGDGPQKGITIPGVYEIKGDELRVCSSDPGKDRPTELSSKKSSGWTLTTLKRVKK